MKSLVFLFGLTLWVTLVGNLCHGFCLPPPTRKILLLGFTGTPRAAHGGTTHTLGMSTVVEEPVTIEKTTQDDTATTTTVQDKASSAAAGTKLPAFLLRLWNDPYNKREFVARCLAEVCGKSDTESFQIMMHAHQSGMGIIGQYDLEIAELYCQSLKERSLLVDMIPVEDE